MNKHQFKQFIHGVFHDDENSRERNLLAHRQKLFLNAPTTVITSLASPDPLKVWGSDVSPWDGNVTLSVTKAKGATFVFIKGLDGTLQARYFAENRTRAIQAGLKQAPYQWLYKAINVSPVAQAQAMKNLLDKYPSDLPPVVDFEWTYWSGQQSNPNWTDLDLYVTELLRLGVQKPILYTAAGYANQFGQIPNALKAKFSAFWFANYGVAIPTLPHGFTTWDFWQFTSSGDAAVYSPNDVSKKEVDLNYYNGTKEQFLARFGFESGGSMIWYKATGNISMRAGAGTNFPNAQINGVNQYVLTGDFVETVQQSNGFVLINRVYRNGVFVAIPPVAWCGMAYLTASAAPVPPVPSVFVTHTFNDVLNIDGKEYVASFTVSNVEYTPRA